MPGQTSASVDCLQPNALQIQPDQSFVAPPPKQPQPLLSRTLAGFWVFSPASLASAFSDLKGLFATLAFVAVSVSAKGDAGGFLAICASVGSGVISGAPLGGTRTPSAGLTATFSFTEAVGLCATPGRLSCVIAADATADGEACSAWRGAMAVAGGAVAVAGSAVVVAGVALAVSTGAMVVAGGVVAVA